MDDRSKHIDDLFREGLNDYQETPPASVWTSLEQRLPAANATVAEQPSKRWLWILLLILLLATVGYFIISKSLESSSSDRKPINEKVENNTPPAPNPSTLPAQHEDVSSLPTDTINSIADAGTSESSNTSKKVTDDASGKKKQKTTKAGHKEDNDGERKADARKNPSSDIADGTTEDASNSSITEPNSHTTNTTGTKLASQKKGKKGKSSSQNDESTAANSPATNKLPEAGTVGENELPGNKVSGNKKTKNKENKETKDVTTTSPGGSKNNSPSVTNNNNGINEQSVGEQKNTDTKSTAKKKDGAKGVNGKTTSNKANNPGNVKNSVEEKQAGITQTPIASKSNSSNKKVAGATGNEKPSAQPKQNRVASKKGNNVPAATDLNKPKETKVASVSNSKPVVPEPSATIPKPIEVKPEKAAGKPILVEPETSKGKTEAAKGEISSGKPIKVEGETSKGKNTDISSSGGQSKSIPVLPDPNKNKEIPITPAKNKPAEAEPIVKNKSIGNEAKKTQVSPKIEPAAKTKKAYERTEDGIAINITDNEKEEQEKKEASEVNKNDDEQAVPTPQGGGGGGPEPSVKLRDFNKIKVEGGIKAGYDRGFGDITTSNFLIAPFLQWNISPRVGLAIQPAVRYNQINKTLSSGGLQAFHTVTNAFLDSTNHKLSLAPIDSTQQKPDTFTRIYKYHNTYDSILLGYSLNDKNYLEIELPLILKYYVAPNLSVFGGLSMTFGSIVKVTQTMQTYSGLKQERTLSYVSTSFTDSFAYPNPAPPNTVNFNYNTPEFSTANVSAGQNPSVNPARFGFLLGFSYELRRRLLIDFLLRGNISDMKYIPNEQIRKIYTQPYLRLTVGYKIFGDKQDRDVNPNGL